MAESKQSKFDDNYNENNPNHESNEHTEDATSSCHTEEQNQKVFHAILMALRPVQTKPTSCNDVQPTTLHDVG